MAVNRPRQKEPDAPTRRTLDWRAVGRGMAAYLIIATVCGLVVAVSQPNDMSSVWTVVAILVLLVAPAVGGGLAGAAGRPSPLTDAVVAVGAPAAVFLVVRILVGAVRGDLTGAQVASFMLYLIVSAGLAMVGGYVGFRHRGRPSASL